MTRRLRPQYADLKLCARCGAPAEIIGKPWVRPDGERTFWSTPVSHKGVTYTHLCSRNAYEDAAGASSDAPEHAYACGAIPASLTTRTTVERAWGRCFEDAERTVQVDIASEFDRQKAAAGDAS